MSDANPSAVTVLRSLDERKPVTKAFFRATNGKVGLRDFDDAKWFSAETVPVVGIRDLHALLLRLESDPAACVIRGEPKPSANRRRMRRLKNGVKATIDEVPRVYLLIDVDGLPLPPGVSVLADPHEAARAVLDALAYHAPELEGVSAVVQFSARAGLDELVEAQEAAGLASIWSEAARAGVRAHVWVCLHTPRGEAELKLWLEALKAVLPPVDAGLARTVQIHYTAAPIFEDGLADPLAGRRTVFLEGTEGAAELVIPAPQPRDGEGASGGGESARKGRGFEAYLDEIGDGAGGFHAPIVSAVASFIATNWPHQSADALKAALRERIRGAGRGSRTAKDIDRYASDEILDGLIDWACGLEEAKAAERTAEAADPVAPTFPDRGVTLAEAHRMTAKAVARFAGLMREGKAPEMMLRKTVGGGKSEAAVQGADGLVAAGRALRGRVARAEAERTAAKAAEAVEKAAAEEDAEAAQEAAAKSLAAAQKAAKKALKEAAKAPLMYLVPRHDLGDEIRGRIAEAHPGQRIVVWYGMLAADPAAPGEKMCRAPELPREAMEAGLDATAACPACPLRKTCGYHRQDTRGADVVIAAHNLAFQGRPKKIAQPGAIVIDEAFWAVGVEGNDGPPVQLALSALESRQVGELDGHSASRLINLRSLVVMALADHPDGGLLREPFARLHFTAASAKEWERLEWQAKPAVEWDKDKPLDYDEILERLRAVRAEGFTPLRPQFARLLHMFLSGDAAQSVSMTFVREANLGRKQGAGKAVRLAWREDFVDWAKASPKLFLDATTHADLVRLWAPSLEVVDIEVQAPAQRVWQIVGREFGRSFFVQLKKKKPVARKGRDGSFDDADEGDDADGDDEAVDADADGDDGGKGSAPPSANVMRLAGLIAKLVAQTPGETLVVAQMAVQAALERAIEMRFGAHGVVRREGTPAGAPTFVFPSGAVLHLAHHGAITGLDRYRNADHVVVVGRPALNRGKGERLAEILKGAPIQAPSDCKPTQWPTVEDAGLPPAGIRMSDGTGRRVRQPHHPDPLVEALRWSISEGAVLQAIGRPRGVQRTRPLRVTLLAQFALPLTVEEVVDWRDAQPDDLTVAAAEVALTGRALPLAVADLSAVRRDLWPTPKAVERYFEERGITPQTLIIWYI